LKDNIKAHLAVLGTNIFFSINFSAVKYLFSQNHVQPFGLNYIRIVVATFLLWVLYFFSKKKITIDPKDYFRLLFCSITGIVLNQLLFIKGLSYTSPIHGALLMLTTPILITFFASIFLKERLSFNKVIGLALGIGGACVLILSRSNNVKASGTMLGDLLILINAVSYMIYFIIVKPLMQKYSPLTVIRMSFTIGLFVALPFCWTEFSSTSWGLFSSSEIWSLAIITIGGTFLAYTFNIYAINKLGASITGNYIYTQPVFAGIIAIGLHQDSLAYYKIAAAVLIFTGLYLANKKNQHV
jgi:drug/metabolite transporter (DMT)-like permease